MVSPTTTRLRLRRKYCHGHKFQSQSHFRFEIIQKDDYSLQHTLTTFVENCASIWRLATSYFGIIPPNSLADKFPYYRLAISTTGTSTRLPLVLDRSFKVEDEILKISRVKQELPEGVQQQKIKGSSKVLEKEESLESTSAFVSGKPVSGSLASKYPLGTRQAKKYYVRDSLTLPGMVVLYNTLLNTCAHMASSGSSTSSKKYRRSTLAILIQALEGTKVVAELHNDTIIRGVLTSSDSALNLQMDEATVKSLDGTVRTVAQLYIKGTKLRMIHLPGNLDPSQTIQAHRKRVMKIKRQHAYSQGNVQRLPKGEELYTSDQ